MLKVKLIDFHKYPSIKQKQLIFVLGFVLLSGILACILFTYLTFSVSCNVLIIFFMVVMFIVDKRFAKEHILLHNKTIKLDKDTISIQSDSANPLEIYTVDTLDYIVVYNPSIKIQNSLKTLRAVLRGKAKTAYLIVQQNNQQQTFHFKLNSYYKVNKFNLIAKDWVKNGCTIELL